MITISVRVCGDAWSNPDEVQLALNQPGPVALDFHNEGVSVGAIGLADMIERSGRDTDSITIVNNPNRTETLPYINTTGPRNHCLDLAKQYWQEPVVPAEIARPFGYFVGRRTISRCVIMYDLWQNFKDQFVFSHMQNRIPVPWIEPPVGINLEQVLDWLYADNFARFTAWYNACPITSIDGHAVRDHYDPDQNTNRDLLTHYDKFVTELVAETYTLGDTFFPTEKTFRPIMSARPILVYGPRNFLSRLRDMGFETYHTCWDEGYDELEGPARWQAIRNLLPTIEVTDVTWAIAYRNRQHLRQLIYDCTNI
jgi:hypothetical protein